MHINANINIKYIRSRVTNQRLFFPCFAIVDPVNKNKDKSSQLFKSNDLKLFFILLCHNFAEKRSQK